MDPHKARLMLYGFDPMGLDEATRKHLAATAKVYSSKELLEMFDEEKLRYFAAQISLEITLFLTESPAGMLPKTVQDILDLVYAGESYMTIASYEGMQFAIAHGANYELLSQSQVENIGYQVIEHGTGMVAEPFRNMHVMRDLVRARVAHANEKYGDKWIGVFTAKQRSTIHSWYRALEGELDVVNWYDSPYLTALTDVCKGDEPRQHGSGFCPLRVAFAQARNWNIAEVMKYNGVKVPCTLVTSTPNRVGSFEERMRTIHREMFNDGKVSTSRIEAGTEIALSGYSLKTADEVYALL